MFRAFLRIHSRRQPSRAFAGAPLPSTSSISADDLPRLPPTPIAAIPQFSSGRGSDTASPPQHPTAHRPTETAKSRDRTGVLPIGSRGSPFPGIPCVTALPNTAHVRRCCLSQYTLYSYVWCHGQHPRSREKTAKRHARRGQFVPRQMNVFPPGMANPWDAWPFRAIDSSAHNDYRFPQSSILGA